MSELTGKGKMSDFDKISNAFITISISPVLRDVLIVSEDLFRTLPSNFYYSFMIKCVYLFEIWV